MGTTVIGVWDEYQPAYSAKNELLSSGFSRRQVQLNPDHESHPAPKTSATGTDDSSVRAGIGIFFRSMFGMGDKSTHSNVYAETVRRGGYVLTVDTENDGQRMHAEEIINCYNPVNIDERSAEWVSHGWRGHDPSEALGAGKARAYESGKQSLDRK